PAPTSAPPAASNAPSAASNARAPAVSASPGAPSALPSASSAPPVAPAAPSAGAAAPWKTLVRALEIRDAIARLEDDSTTPPFRSTLADLKVKATDLGNAAGNKGKVELSLTTDLGATITGDAAVTLTPVSAQGKLSTVGINLKKLFPYYQSAL